MFRLFKGNKDKNKKFKENEITSAAPNSTKGTEYDSMENQIITKRTLDKATIDGLMSNIGLTKTIVEAPVVDMLKNDFSVSFKIGTEENEEINEKFKKYMEQLDFINVLKEALITSRLYGSAYIYYVTEQRNGKETADNFDGNDKILSMNVFNKFEVSKAYFNDNKFKSNYKKLESIEVKQKIDKRTRRYIIDSTRLAPVINNVLHEQLGESIINSIFLNLIILSNTEWSIGQIIFRAAFLAYKGGGDTIRDIAEGKLNFKEQEINSKTFMFMGKDDDILTVNSAAGIDPNNFMDAVVSMLSIHTNIPKQRLVGNTLGAISGSEEDAKKYAEFLTRIFNDMAKPVIENFIDKFILINGYSDITYEIVLDSLVEIDELTKANTSQAEAAAITTQLGTIKTVIDLLNIVGVNVSKNDLESVIKDLKISEILDGSKLESMFKNTKVINDNLISFDMENIKATAEATRVNAISTLITSITSLDFESNRASIIDKARELTIDGIDITRPDLLLLNATSDE